jgi:hypothetical protein
LTLIVGYFLDNGIDWKRKEKLDKLIEENQLISKKKGNFV